MDYRDGEVRRAIYLTKRLRRMARRVEQDEVVDIDDRLNIALELLIAANTIDRLLQRATPAAKLEDAPVP